MTIYRYNAGSLIDEVRIVTNATGGHRAYLHARSDATPEQLAEIKESFLKQGLKTVPYSDQGSPQLEVRGFKQSEAFISTLAAHGWTQGTPEIVKLKSEEATKSDRAHSKTLKWTGWIYNLGDAAYLTYTLKDFAKHKKALANLEKLATDPKAIEAANETLHAAKLDIGGGIGYAMGGAVLSFFASKDQSQNEIKNGVKKVRNFMMKEGVTIPQDVAAHNLTQKDDKPPLHKLGDFLRKHPSEILNSVYVGVGILLASASLKKVSATRVRSKSIFDKANSDAMSDLIDVGLGGVTMTSALIGLLVKEKKREPDEPKQTGIRGVWQWIQEKPLRATGVGYGISTAFHAWATVRKYKAGDASVRDTVKYRAVFVAANVLAEVMLFLSSKGHGQGVKADDSVEKSVIATTAELISKQNPGYQNQLVEQLAGYMASPEVLGGKAENIAAELRTQLAGMQNHPWVEKPAQAAQLHIAPTPAAVVTPHVPHTTVAAASIDPSVLTKMAAQPAAQAIGA